MFGVRFLFIMFYYSKLVIFIIFLIVGEVIDHDILVHSAYEWINRVRLFILFFVIIIIIIYSSVREKH